MRTFRYLTASAAAAAALVLVAGAATGAALVLANTAFTSARDHTVERPSLQTEQPAAFGTAPIVTSDPAISTYGMGRALSTSESQAALNAHHRRGPAPHAIPA